MIATVDNLNDILEFDHVVEVSENHDVTSVSNLYAPSIIDSEIDSDDWEFFSNGYTGQHGYNGPIMHDSEYIGGMLAEDILNEPGIYVAVVSAYIDDSEDGITFEGWAVLRYVGKD